MRLCEFFPQTPLKWISVIEVEISLRNRHFSPQLLLLVTWTLLALILSILKVHIFLFSNFFRSVKLCHSTSYLDWYERAENRDERQTIHATNDDFRGWGVAAYRNKNNMHLMFLGENG
jgi:hypothetical protein